MIMQELCQEGTNYFTLEVWKTFPPNCTINSEPTTAIMKRLKPIIQSNKALQEKQKNKAENYASPLPRHQQTIPHHIHQHSERKILSNIIPSLLVWTLGLS